ncbi:MAG: hypothetical protein R3C68_08320 [Myxococcota bacterium]
MGGRRRGGPNTGFVIASGVLAGPNKLLTAANLENVLLAEGAQFIHAEAREIDGEPNTFSLATGCTEPSPTDPCAFASFSVDTVAPSVNTFVLTQNTTGNDAAPLFRLSASEGSVSSGILTTGVTVTVTGVEDGRLLRVLSNIPAANTLVGQGTVTSGQASFNVALSQNTHALTVSVTDQALNPAPVTITLNAKVDVTKGTVAVPAPANDPFRAIHGTIADQGTPSLTDDTLAINLSLTVSDNSALGGTTLTLGRYTAVTGGSLIPGSQVQVNLANGQTNVDIVGYPLPPGLNHLEATFTDIAGNVASSTIGGNRQTYRVDFYGPTLTLAAVDENAVTLGCGTTSGAACVADTLAPDGNNRIQFDLDGTDPYCPTLNSACNLDTERANNLAFTLSGCSNSDVSIEDCSAPIDVRLQSRLSGTGSFATVFESTFASADVGATLYTAVAPTFAFDAGVVREVRLTATDHSGNVSVSPVLYLALNEGGVAVDTELLNAALGSFVPPVPMADDADFGIAENIAGPADFAANLRVTLTPLTTEIPDQVALTVNAPSAAPPLSYMRTCLISDPCWNAAGGTVDFSGVDSVQLATSTDPLNTIANTVDITVMCGAITCGSRQYTGVVADIDPPTYQFDRCSLCQLDVPFEDDATACATLPTSCTTANDAATADILNGQSAVWNTALDQDSGAPLSVFNIKSAPALVVRLKGLVNGINVTLTSNRGGLVNNVVSSSGCASGNCAATFNNLEVPTLGGALDHQISVSFTDRAGNPAQPDPGRSNEVISAITDTLIPDSTAPTVCIGESTVPGGLDPGGNTEDPGCAALCALPGSACDRRAGEATLTWTAPSDDGSSTNPVTSYDVRVAALEIPYGASTYSDCSELTDSTEVEQTVSLAATAAPGDPESTVVTGLFPHRVYCFAVVGIDDVGNRASITGVQVDRALPLRTDIPGVAGRPDAIILDPGSPDDNAQAITFADAGLSDLLEYAPVVIGDMDGDGRDEFAILERDGESTTTTAVWQVQLFLSSSVDLTSPDFTILSPTASPDFDFAMVRGGDFDGDGLADMVITSYVVATTGAGGGDFGGGVYIYYGVQGAGINNPGAGTAGEMPSIAPDVALLGPAFGGIGWSLTLGDVDGRTNALGNRATISFVGSLITQQAFGWGGARKRLVASFLVDTSTMGSGWPTDPPANPTRPDFSLQAASVAPGGAFPWALVTADLDGDGIREIAASDQLRAHGGDVGNYPDAGEVYVYRGGTSLAGAIATPNTAPPQLMTTLRFRPIIDHFGFAMFRIPAPRDNPLDVADWLFVMANRAGGVEVPIFKGVQGTGIAANAYPAGVAGITFNELDHTRWDGGNAIRFGLSMAFLGEYDGHPGSDIAVGTNVLDPATDVFLYSFDATSDFFVKRAVLQGTTSIGSGVTGVRDYLGVRACDGFSDQPTCDAATGCAWNGAACLSTEYQLIVGSLLSADTSGRVGIFR